MLAKLPAFGRGPRRVMTWTALLAAILSGCGSGGGGGVTAPPPPAAPPAPVTIVVDEGSRNLSSRFITWHSFVTSRPGDLQVTVDWASAGNNLDVFLARGACDPDQLDAGVCIVMGAAESPTAKPETITVPSAVQGLFTLFVVNLGATTETFSYRATLTYTPAATTEQGVVR